VAVTLGKVSPGFKPEGFGFKQPFITHIHPTSIRQQTRAMPAECYSSDLQQVKMEVHVLYRVPEHSVVKIFQEYAGEPFDNLIAPRVQEAIKEVAATQSAEQIVKKREEVKVKALELAQRKIGTHFLEVIDVVLYNLSLSPELEQAVAKHEPRHVHARPIRLGPAVGRAHAHVVSETGVTHHVESVRHEP
jgi:prohibitin 2